MCSTAERAKVVAVAISRGGSCHQIVRRQNGTYMIRGGGVLLESLYWRAGELDRCMRTLEQMTADELQTKPAAA